MGRFIILSGPSCVGKGPLHSTFSKFYPELAASLQKLVLYNCRSPRPAEIDGKDYRFRSREEIEAFRKKENFVVLDVRGDLQAADLADAGRSSADQRQRQSNRAQDRHGLAAALSLRSWLGLRHGRTLPRLSADLCQADVALGNRRPCVAQMTKTMSKVTIKGDTRQFVAFPCALGKAPWCAADRFAERVRCLSRGGTVGMIRARLPSCRGRCRGAFRRML